MKMNLWRDNLTNFLENFLRRFRPKKTLYVEDYRAERFRPVKHSRSLVLPLILLTVFLGSVVFTLVRERARVRGEQTFRVLGSVEDELVAARDLVGLDDPAVKEKLARAREGLEQVRVLGVSQRRVETLSQEIDKVEEKILKVYYVSSHTVYDFSSQGREVELAALAATGDPLNLIVLDRGQEQLFRVTWKNDRSQIEKLPLKVPSLSLGLDFSDEIGIVWSESVVAAFDGEGASLGKTSLDFSGDVVDVKSYASGVYILSKSENNVFKVSLQDDHSFSSPNPWLKDQLEIGGNSRLAIDGDVYIWIGDTLRRFRRGREIDFFLREDVGVPLSSPQSIVVWRESTGIYILDSENLRVLRFSKDGALLGQYVDDKWADLKSLAISSDERKGYVLSGNKVLEFEIP